jgi:proline iminopeptidase
MRKTTIAAGVAVGGLAVALASRFALLNAGATCEERHRAMPGDDVVPDARSSSTMAVTIDAPPAAVWPWLVQMGCDRAGFYAWDRLDNGGRPSADTIHPEWQKLEIGDRIMCTPSGEMWLEVVELEPEQTLVLRGTFDLRQRRSFTGEPSGRHSTGTWTFTLEPTDDGARTRLVARGRVTGKPWLPIAAMNLVFWDPAHFVMQRRQFHNLRLRAERTALAESA